MSPRKTAGPRPRPRTYRNGRAGVRAHRRWFAQARRPTPHSAVARRTRRPDRCRVRVGNSARGRTHRRLESYEGPSGREPARDSMKASAIVISVLAAAVPAYACGRDANARCPRPAETVARPASPAPIAACPAEAPSAAAEAAGPHSCAPARSFCDRSCMCCGRCGRARPAATGVRSDSGTRFQRPGERPTPAATARTGAGLSRTQARAVSPGGLPPPDADVVRASVLLL